MRSAMAAAVLLALAAPPAFAQQRGGRPGGGHGAGWGHARPRGGGVSGAALRHPRAGTGSYYYGHGYGHGYGYGRYPYYGYGHYPYYGYYPYYSPYAWGYPAFSLGLGFYSGGESVVRVHGADTSGASYGEAPGEFDRGESAELRLLVEPGDASIYVDDEFRGVARQTTVVPVTPGRHRVEVVRPGFKVAEHRVEVGPGEAAPLHIQLERR